MPNSEMLVERQKWGFMVVSTLYKFFFGFQRTTFVRSAWPMTSGFKGFSIPDFIHYFYFPILVLGKEPVFSFSMLSAKQGNYWYHFYNVFGMTWSLTGDRTPTRSQHSTTRLSRRRVSVEGSINFNKTTEWELYILQYHQHQIDYIALQGCLYCVHLLLWQ